METDLVRRTPVPDATTQEPKAQTIAQQMVPWVRQIMTALWIANVSWLPLPFLTGADRANVIIGDGGALICLFGVTTGLLLLRRGRLEAAVLVTALGLMVSCTFSLVFWGLKDGAGIMIILLLGIMLPALLAIRRWLIGFTLYTMVLIGSLGLVPMIWPGSMGFVSSGPYGGLIIAGSFILAVTVMAVFLERFSSSLHGALRSALERGQALEAHGERLEALVAERTDALQHLADQLTAQNQELLQNLELARDIQLGLLPREVPWDQRRLAIACYSEPALNVGGDFYTYMALGDERALIVLGDISGKGVGAALVMALTLSTIEDRIQQMVSPGALLTALNAQLMPRLQQSRMNAALLCVALDLRGRTLTVANAGMIPPLIVGGTGVRELDIGGFPLGALDTAEYQEQRFDLHDGDLIMLLSDGVVEAQSEAHELFGFERLEQALLQLPSDVQPEQAVSLVLEHTHAFVGAARKHDDMTIVALRPRFYER